MWQKNWNDKRGAIFFWQLRNPKVDGFVKSLILLAPQAILGFMIRLAK
jgi:hypothetical protein